MLQPTYPGIYIQEIPGGVHTITGVATAITAFLGRTAKGAIDKAVRLHSLSDFSRELGAGHRESDMGDALRLFFANGGGDCYVVRVAHNPRAANLALRNLASNDVLRVTASNAGSWGNNLYLTVDYDTDNADETFNLQVSHEEGGRALVTETFSNLAMDPNAARYAPDFVTASSRLVRVQSLASASTLTGYSESRRVLDPASLLADLNALVNPPAGTAQQSRFEIGVDGGAFWEVDLGVGGALAGADGNAVAAAIGGRINTQLNGFVAGLQVRVTWQTLPASTLGVFRIASDTGTDASVRIRRAATRDIASALMLGVDQGGVEIVRYSDMRPVPNATLLTGSLQVLAGLPNDAFDHVDVTGATAGEIDLGTSLQTAGAGRDWYLDALPNSPNHHSDGIREKLRILATRINAAVAVRTDLSLRAEVWGSRLAVIPTAGTNNASVDFATTDGAGGGTDIGPGGGGTALFTANTRRYVLGNTGSSSFQNGPGQTGRDDDGNDLTVGDIIGNPAQHTGMYALDLVDIFNLMVIPADRDIDNVAHQQLWGTASTYCKAKRAFLLVDPPSAWTSSAGRLAATSVEVNSLRSLVVKESTAVYYPNVRFIHQGRRKTMGPSPLMAGLMARIDGTRGVWKAPAGIEADLRNILGLEVELTDQENGVLNKLGANCLRQFPSGFVSWGARTLAGTDAMTSEWKYVPIRRLALFLEESLFRGTKWVVFEPNDEPLWAKIRMNLNAFMKGLFRQGAFQGATPDQAYYVKCDDETTTQADRNLGIVNIEVGFAPLKPAEFVIIKIQQIAGELE